MTAMLTPRRDFLHFLQFIARSRGHASDARFCGAFWNFCIFCIFCGLSGGETSEDTVEGIWAICAGCRERITAASDAQFCWCLEICAFPAISATARALAPFPTGGNRIAAGLQERTRLVARAAGMPRIMTESIVIPGRWEWSARLSMTIVINSHIFNNIRAGTKARALPPSSDAHFRPRPRSNGSRLIDAEVQCWNDGLASARAAIG